MSSVMESVRCAAKRAVKSRAISAGPVGTQAPTRGYFCAVLQPDFCYSSNTEVSEPTILQQQQELTKIQIAYITSQPSGKMDFSPLRLLRPKLSLVLDFLDPLEHQAFSSTCRANLKAVQQYREDKLPFIEIWRRRAASDNPQFQRPATGMDLSPLGVLPPELAYHILDFMYPHEYSGLPCTCQGMLSIVNRKLDTPQSRDFASRNPYVSRTAAFVKAEHQVIIWGELPEDVGCCWIPPTCEADWDL
jgi:hypothetical protein